MGFKETMAVEKGNIEREISAFFERERAACPSRPEFQTMLDALEEFTQRGGKRIRSVLLLMGYLSAGGDELDKARRAAVSMELVQDLMLIHDDLIDSSPERRGRPSFHMVYEGMHEKNGYRGDPSEFGRNMALIGGDLAESLANRALLSSGFPPKRLRDAMSCQACMVRDTGLGQLLDVMSQAAPGWTEEMVLMVHRYKTARYTFEGPLHIGAHLAGAKARQLRALSEYAIPVGTAFQITDDIIGFFGDPKRGGASDISDIREGKRTMLIVKALEVCEGKERAEIESALSNKALSVKEAERIRGIVRSSGSVDYSKMMADELTREGIKALDGPHLSEVATRFLRDLALHLNDRA